MAAVCELEAPQSETAPATRPVKINPSVELSEVLARALGLPRPEDKLTDLQLVEREIRSCLQRIHGLTQPVNTSLDQMRATAEHFATGAEYFLRLRNIRKRLIKRLPLRKRQVQLLTLLRSQ